MTKKNKRTQLFYVTRTVYSRLRCAEGTTYLYNQYANEFTPRQQGCPTFSRKRAKEIVNRLNAKLPGENWLYRIRYGMVAVDAEVAG